MILMGIASIAAAAFWAASRCPLGRAIALGFDQLATQKSAERGVLD